MTIHEILMQLRATSSRLEKERILNEHRDNETLKQVFEYTYDEQRNFWISKAPTIMRSMLCMGMPQALRELDENICNRKLTGNAAREFVSGIKSVMSIDDARVIDLILDRDLDVGATVSTANKIWPGLIKIWPIMLCESDKPKNRAKIKFPAKAQIKSDGGRINIIGKLDQKTGVWKYEARTRNGKPVDCLNDAILADLNVIAADLEPLEWFLLDGEIIGTRDGKLMPRKESNGLVSKAMKGTATKDIIDLLSFDCWDLLLDELAWDSGYDITKYDERFLSLQETLEVLAVHDNPKKAIRLIESKEVNSWEEVSEFYAEALERGLEGLIVKNNNAAWVNDRTDDQIKLKAELEGTFEVEGWNTGNGRRASTVGSLKCKSADGGIRFNLSGFNDEILAQIVKENYWDGKFVDVMYNEVISSKDGSRSLFLPRFIRERPDKDKADIL